MRETGARPGCLVRVRKKVGGGQVSELNMRNREWVKTQFELFRKHNHDPRYRDVLVLTSFIESAIRDTASKSKFKPSLEALGLRIDPQNEKKSSYEPHCPHKKDCLRKINLLRIQRNELLHDIIRRRLPKKYIEDTIKKMAKNIGEICSKSKVVGDYFSRNYEFDPATLV